MSAFAFVVCDKDEVLILSEGIVMFNYDGKGSMMRFQDNESKFLKLNNSLCFAAVGAEFGMKGLLEENLDKLKNQSIDEIELFITNGLNFAKKVDPKNFSQIEYQLSLVGFNGSQIEQRKCVHPNTSFETTIVMPGQAGCTQIPGEKLLHELIVDEINSGHYEDVKSAAKSAFEKMIRRAEARGIEVGGQIFSDTIVPKHK